MWCLLNKSSILQGSFRRSVFGLRPHGHPVLQEAAQLFFLFYHLQMRVCSSTHGRRQAVTWSRVGVRCSCSVSPWTVWVEECAPLFWASLKSHTGDKMQCRPATAGDICRKWIYHCQSHLRFWHYKFALSDKTNLRCETRFYVGSSCSVSWLFVRTAACQVPKCTIFLMICLLMAKTCNLYFLSKFSKCNTLVRH